MLSVVLLAAGISATSFAQQKSTSQSKSTYASSSKTSTKDLVGTTNQASDDTLFMKRALAIGVAEIEFAQVALQNSSSEKVKNFAQKMIEDHTSANNKLLVIMNGSSEDNTVANTTPANTGNADATGAGTGTVTGVGTGEKAGTDSTGNIINRQNDTTGITSGGVSSTTGTRTDSISMNSSTAISTDSSTTTITSDRTSVVKQPVPPVAKPTTELKLSGTYLDIKNKLETLSGVALDRQYVQQAVKDHNLTIKLLENYQKEGSNPKLKAWIKEQLPIARKHKAESTKLSASLGGAAKKYSKS